MNFLFPYTRYTFDFNSPSAPKNSLFAPHNKDFTALEKGRFTKGDTVSIYASNQRILESATLEIASDDVQDKPAHLSGEQVTVKRGWAATFFPSEKLLTDFTNLKIVEYQGTYYELRKNTLYPFVTEKAALSYVPKEMIETLTDALFAGFMVSDEFVGFRPGTLLAYVDGVFVVTPENTIRPFGSAEILLRLGYTFQHVITATAEDVGIYTRKDIILTEQLHPSGTLFKDTDTRQLFLFTGNTLAPLTDRYGTFLEASNDVVPFSQSESEKAVTCTLRKKFFQKSFWCTADVIPLRGAGSDYQITLTNNKETTDVSEFTVGLQASRKLDNARFVIILIANRILLRVGLL